MCRLQSIKVSTLKVIHLKVQLTKDKEYDLFYPLPYNAVSPLFCSQPLILLSLLQPPPLPPPLDILSHYIAWFGSPVCVHVVPLCKRPRLKLCGKSLASFLNTPGITVQGPQGGRKGERKREKHIGRRWGG